MSLSLQLIGPGLVTQNMLKPIHLLQPDKLELYQKNKATVIEQFTTRYHADVETV